MAILNAVLRLRVVQFQMTDRDMYQEDSEIIRKLKKSTENQTLLNEVVLPILEKPMSSAAQKYPVCKSTTAT